MKTLEKLSDVSKGFKDEALVLIGFKKNTKINKCLINHSKNFTFSDINECTKHSGMCHGGRCKNTPGSFKCECPAGFMNSSDGFSCMGKYTIPEYTAKVTQEYGMFVLPGYSHI